MSKGDSGRMGRSSLPYRRRAVRRFRGLMDPLRKTDRRSDEFTLVVVIVAVTVMMAVVAGPLLILSMV